MVYEFSCPTYQCVTRENRLDRIQHASKAVQSSIFATAEIEKGSRKQIFRAFAGGGKWTWVGVWDVVWGYIYIKWR